MSLFLEAGSAIWMWSSFLCRVCGKYPKQAKVSINCRHIYCKICIDNYKAGVNTTKYPPAHAAIEEETGNVENSCNIPSEIADIINIAGFLQEIHESIQISCSKENCGKTFTVCEIAEHEESCRAREFYQGGLLFIIPLQSCFKRSI